MRKDGKRVTKMDSVHGVMPFLMKNRCDSEIYYVEQIDVTTLLEYIDKENKNKEDKDKITLFHTIITAMAKTIYNRPLLNRFIVGQRYYDRNEISFSFIAKNKLEDNAQERLILLKMKEDMTINDISNTILKMVSETRENNTNDINDRMEFITKLPKFVLNFIMWVNNRLDNHGMVPRFITDIDPNYTSCLLSNLGSIRADACYHHLNNYGTNSIVSTIGVIHDASLNGKNRKVINVSFTIDERIADGVYFVKSIELFKYILENPKLISGKISDEIIIKKNKSK